MNFVSEPTRCLMKLTYFLLDIFNTRTGFLSSFPIIFSKFAQFLYIKLRIWNLIRFFGEGVQQSLQLM